MKAKATRSIKLMKNASNRTRKLARDMLVFWKRVDKEMVLSYSDFYFKHDCMTFLNMLPVTELEHFFTVNQYDTASNNKIF